MGTSSSVEAYPGQPTALEWEDQESIAGTSLRLTAHKEPCVPPPKLDGTPEELNEASSAESTPPEAPSQPSTNPASGGAGGEREGDLSPTTPSGKTVPREGMLSDALTPALSDEATLTTDNKNRRAITCTVPPSLEGGDVFAMKVGKDWIDVRVPDGLRAGDTFTLVIDTDKPLHENGTATLPMFFPCFFPFWL